MDTQSAFSANLQELLDEKQLSPKQLSEKVNISLFLIYKYLDKSCIPSTVHAVKLADYFHCSLDFLFGLIEEYQEIKFLPCPLFSVSFQKILIEKNVKRSVVKENTPFSKQSIDDWFHGIHTPKIVNLILLADYFNVSLDYLVGRSDSL